MSARVLLLLLLLLLLLVVVVVVVFLVFGSNFAPLQLCLSITPLSLSILPLSTLPTLIALPLPLSPPPPPQKTLKIRPPKPPVLAVPGVDPRPPGRRARGRRGRGRRRQPPLHLLARPTGREGGRGRQRGNPQARGRGAQKTQGGRHRCCRGGCRERGRDRPDSGGGVGAADEGRGGAVPWPVFEQRGGTVSVFSLCFGERERRGCVRVTCSGQTEKRAGYLLCWLLCCSCF